ncbi:hypothetical protein PybrP1_000621 [[Pythium] brassicae (nom. inval.)]|nr:hypothetical protein PybrP1_000621 [[Pythium] brassicae (nom. inval.)]
MSATATRDAHLVTDLPGLNGADHPIAGVDFAGFAIGNAYTDVVIDGNANIDYLYSHGILSLESFRAIQTECGREGIGCVFADEVCSDKCSELLVASVEAAQEDKFNPYFIYGDICLLSNNQTAALRRAGKAANSSLAPSALQQKPRRSDIGPCADAFTQDYLNQKSVQQAIHVEDFVEWVDCSDAVGGLFTSSVSALPKYPSILGKGLDILIYSGDADSNVNFMGTERWIGEEGLKLHVTKKWEAWFGPDQQLAGYAQGYDGLTYKTIKGAGHMVPAVKPLHGLYMFECFVFGDVACNKFAYPRDLEEVASGVVTDLASVGAMLMWVELRLLRPTGARGFHRSVGIVGMPNVGKSTLFNALTKTENAQAANYPFCTIDPNIARVAVPDERVRRLAELEFVDIAGLVRGASKGEGLGNKFLENIRQVAVIAHVVRCFEDTNILHVDNSVDPLRDLDTIRTELILADLQTVERRLAGLAKKKKSADPTLPDLLAVLERLQPHLEDGQQALALAFDKPEELLQFERLQLLTAKKAMYLCNVSEDDAAAGNDMTAAVRARVEAEGSLCLTVSGSLEEAAASFEDEPSQLEYLAESGLSETGLTKVIRASKDLLQLQTYYTVGEKEARAWNVPFGATAPMAAGVIHSDFERLFIRAETVAYEDFERSGSMKAAKDKGFMRSEGKEYVCKDGDIYNFLVGK